MAAHAEKRRLHEALATKDDAACCQMLRFWSTGAGVLPPVSFEELVTAGMAHSAVALARLEVGSDDLSSTFFNDSDGTTYMHAAAAADAGEAVVQALLAAGCALDARDEEGETALHAAARAGAAIAVTTLLAAGTDPLIRSGKHNRTARAVAAAGGQEEARALLAKAEEASKGKAAARQEALWGGKLSGCQTSNATSTGTC